MAFTPDGKALICLQNFADSGEAPHGRVNVWDVQGKSRRQWALTDQYCHDLVFDPADAKSVLVATNDQIFRMALDPAASDKQTTLRLVGRFALPMNWKLAKQYPREHLRISPDGRTVACVEDRGKDGRKLRRGMLENGNSQEPSEKMDTITFTLPAEDKDLGRVKYRQPLGFSPGGKMLAVLLYLESKDIMSAEFYDPATGARVPKPLYLLDRGSDGTFSADGRLFAAAENGSVKVWEVAVESGR